MKLVSFGGNSQYFAHNLPEIPVGRWDDDTERRLFEATHNIGSLCTRMHLIDTDSKAGVLVAKQALSVAKSVAYDQRSIGIEVFTGRVDREDTQTYLVLGSNQVHIAGGAPDNGAFSFPDFVDTANHRAREFGLGFLFSL